MIPGRKDRRARDRLNHRARVDLLLAAAPEEDLGVVGKQLPRVFEMHRIVLLAALHPAARWPHTSGAPSRRVRASRHRGAPGRAPSGARPPSGWFPGRLPRRPAAGRRFLRRRRPIPTLPRTSRHPREEAHRAARRSCRRRGLATAPPRRARRLKRASISSGALRSRQSRPGDQAAGYATQNAEPVQLPGGIGQPADARGVSGSQP